MGLLFLSHLTRRVRERSLGDRLAYAALAVATVWFALVAAWEAFGPLDCGHYCSSSLVAMGGENMLKWKIFAAAQSISSAPPPVEQYYTHHPYGLYVSSAVAHALLGHGAFTVRAPAIVYSALMPALVFATSRAIWGTLPAVVATVIFVLVPINLAFANFSSSLELVTMFWGLVFSWAGVRFLQTSRRRWLWLSIVGALGACHGDWIGIALAGLVAGFWVCTQVLPPAGIFPRVHPSRFALWQVLMLVTGLGTVALYLYLFHKIGRLPDLMNAATHRSSGADDLFRAVLLPRRYMWVSWTLPFIVLALIPIAFPISVARLTKGHQEEGIFFAWFLASFAQYFMFRQGADIHVFWPHYFGVVVAFAGAIVAWLVSGLVQRFAKRPLTRAAWGVGFGVLAIIYAVVLGRLGVEQLYQARLTSGRFDEGGNFIDTERGPAVFAAAVSSALPPQFDLTLHTSFLRHANVEYAGGRVVRHVGGTPSAGEADPGRYTLVDTRRATVDELQAMARMFAPVASGPFWLVDRAKPHSPIVATRWVDRQPRGLERYTRVGADLVYEYDASVDPWSTWSLRDALGQITDDTEPSPPTSLSELCVAYNMASKRGQPDETSALLARVDAMLAVRPVIAYSHDVTLRGWTVETGAVPVANLVWETGPSFERVAADFYVRSRVVAPPKLWPSAIDFHEKEVAPKNAIWPSLANKKRLYLQRFPVAHRIGTEVYEGYFSLRNGRDVPKLMDGRMRLPLFVLE